MSLKVQNDRGRPKLPLQTLKLKLSLFKSGCQRKPGKMLKMSTEGVQQNQFILTS